MDVTAWARVRVTSVPEIDTELTSRSPWPAITMNALSAGTEFMSSSRL